MGLRFYVHKSYHVRLSSHKHLLRISNLEPSPFLPCSPTAVEDLVHVQHSIPHFVLPIHRQYPPIAVKKRPSQMILGPDNITEAHHAHLAIGRHVLDFMPTPFSALSTYLRFLIFLCIYHEG